MSDLGHHSTIYHFTNSKVVYYKWAHKVIQPWGESISMQCKQCGVLQEWLPATLEGGTYSYECRNMKCRYDGEDQALEAHSFTVQHSANCQLLHSKRQSLTAWLKFAV